MGGQGSPRGTPPRGDSLIWPLKGSALWTVPAQGVPRPPASQLPLTLMRGKQKEGLLARGPLARWALLFSDSTIQIRVVERERRVLGELVRLLHFLEEERLRGELALPWLPEGE
ncbi:MAG: hypothetical protein QW356_04885 [Candidatus Hadarchaeales archaeon]